MKWTKDLPGGKRITYTYEQVEGNGAILGAVVEGDQVGVATTSKTPLTQEQVEAQFKEYAGKGLSK